MDAFIAEFSCIGIAIIVVALWLIFVRCPFKKGNRNITEENNGIPSADQTPQDIHGDNEHSVYQVEISPGTLAYVMVPPPTYESIYGPLSSLPAYDSIHVPKATMAQVPETSETVVQVTETSETVLQATETSGASVVAMWIFPKTPCLT